ISVILVLDARFTSPAMLITWLLGLTLIMTGNWFPPSGWLVMKLVAVFLLSGFHGILTGSLRKTLKGNGGSPPPTFRYAGFPFAVTATLVVLMATTKPF
ncbi:MAG: CopD family protein, partial [Sneathiella sp.]